MSDPDYNHLTTREAQAETRPSWAEVALRVMRNEALIREINAEVLRAPKKVYRDQHKLADEIRGEASALRQAAKFIEQQMR
jgi:hypothetical protein